MSTKSRLPGSSNFTAAAYYSGGAALASGDQANFEYGGDVIDTNILNPGLDLLGFLNGSGSRYNYGAAGSPMQFDCDRTSTGVIENYGLGDYWYLMAGTGTGVFNKIVNNPANRAHRFVISSGAITLLEHAAGLVQLGSAVTGTTIRVMGGDLIADYHASNALATIDVTGGRVELAKDFTTLNVLGGEVIIDDQSNGTTFGAINIYGGTLKWRNGNLGNIVLKGGVFDKSGIAKAGLSCGTIQSWAGAKEIMAPKTALEPSTSTLSYVGGGATKVS